AVWVTVLTTFQLASTALTVTLKAVPAPAEAGTPSLPVALPGAAVSPGTSSCILAKVPAFTVIVGLVLGDLPPSLMSLAVTVALPAVLRLILKVRVPFTNAVLPGRLALLSEEVIATVSVTLVIPFQLASTALTV